MDSAWQRDSERNRRAALAALAAAMAIAAALLLWITRDGTLLIDEWHFGYFDRTGHGVHDLLAPHNGHLMVFPIVLTKALLQLFGADAAIALRLVAVAVHLLVVGLVYVFLRRELGPLAALAPAVLVLFLGAASNVCVGSQSLPITIAIASGLGAWLAIVRRGAGWDLLASLLLTVAVCSNGCALPFAVGAGALILLDRESPRSRLWIPAVPLALYMIWWLAEGRGDGQLAIANVAAMPAYMFDSLGATLASITGLFTLPGSRDLSFDLPAAQALAAAFLATLLVLVVGFRYRPPRAVVVPIATLLLYWFLTASVAGVDRLPQASRFLYAGVCLLLIALARAISASRVRSEAIVALTAICAFALLPNLRELAYGGDLFREQSEIDRAELGVADLLTGRTASGTTIETEDEDTHHNAVDLEFPFVSYEAARARFGSPALTVAEIYAASPEARAAADRLAARALPISTRLDVAPAQPLAPQLDPEPAGGQLARARGCLRFEPELVGATLTLNLPVGGLQLRPAGGQPVPIHVRRFADGFETAVGAALPGRRSLLDLPAGPAARGWEAQLAPTQSVLVCGS